MMLMLKALLQITSGANLLIFLYSSWSESCNLIIELSFFHTILEFKKWSETSNICNNQDGPAGFELP